MRTLFHNFQDVPRTEGIKYAGSKLKILPYILDTVSSLDVNTIMDGFSGSTRVSQMFAHQGYNVISNDISAWSQTFATAYLLHDKPVRYYQELIDYLNNLKGYEGWYSLHYGGTENSTEKRPFQLKNTIKLDAIRDEIDRLHLSAVDKAVALTSLILALDAVDNTLGHYCSYLSGWSTRSYHDIILKVPSLCPNVGRSKVYQEDIFNLIRTEPCDLAYFDPPYGSNNEKMPSSRVRYNAYYHIWTSIVLNDKPEVFGKANRRIDSRDGVNDSVFEAYRKDDDGHYTAMNAIRELIRKTDAKYILLSYSSGGRATKKDLCDILETEGLLLKCLEIDYKTNVMGQMRWTNEWVNSDARTCEYLFLVKK